MNMMKMSVQEAINHRIQELHNVALAKKIKLSSVSEKDLLSSLSNQNMSVRPFVTLLDGGNLRALWKDKGEQIGLQFLGGGRVQYVFAVWNDTHSKIIWECGRDAIEGAWKKIKDLGLERLVAGKGKNDD